MEGLERSVGSAMEITGIARARTRLRIGAIANACLLAVSDREVQSEGELERNCRLDFFGIRGYVFTFIFIRYSSPWILDLEVSLSYSVFHDTIHLVPRSDEVGHLISFLI